MANSKLVEVKFFGKSHTYDFVIDEKNVTVSDNDGNGLIGKGDKIVEDNLDAFKKYKKIAQAVVTQFRKDLPSELNIAAKQLKDGKVISARRLPGQHGPLPSQRQHDSSYAVDFNGDGKTDIAIFVSTKGVHVEIQMPCYDSPQLAEKCDTKAVEGYLRLFDL